MKKRVLILGGCGFIGSHVVDRFCLEGHPVRVLSRRPEIFRSPIEGVDYRFGEFGNQKFLEASLVDIDTVIHLISSTTPKDSNEDMAFDIENNLIQTVRALHTFTRSNVKKVVFISSGGAIYGNPEKCPVEEESIVSPLCSYGVVKYSIEKYLELFRSLFGLQSVVLRVANPFGPRQNPIGIQGIVSNALNNILKAKPVVIWGDGSAVRDFFFVEDLADAIYKAAVNNTLSNIINIGSGVGTSIREILRLIRETIDLNFEVRYERSRDFDVKQIFLDVSRAKSEIGWVPQTSIIDGLQSTWEFFTRKSNYNPK